MPPDRHDRRPLLPARLRAPALVVVSLCTILTLALGIRYTQQDGPGRLDHTLDRLASSHLGDGDWLSSALVSLGDPLGAVVLVLAVVVASALARFWAGVALAALATPIAVGITEFVLKPSVGRRFGETLSYPSGHTTAVASIAVVVAVLLAGVRRRRGYPLWVVASMAMLATAASVSVALVVNHDHYATDTFGGWCVSLATVLGTALVIDAIGQRIRPSTEQRHRSTRGVPGPPAPNG